MSAFVFNNGAADWSLPTGPSPLQHADEVGVAQEFQERIDAQLIGDSPAMRRFRAHLLRLALASSRCEGSKPPVLIHGETGAGKEVVARLCHNNAGPFVELNCAALPEQLLEAELFGYERGAFTGAQGPKIGLMEAADNGTLFLDEVAEASPSVQAKLLKAIEEQSVRRLGALQARQVKVRVIAATHADLDQRVREGRFRADLLYRLRVVQLKLPSLRERENDALLLARHFLATCCARYGRGPMEFSTSAAQALMNWRWPGNVRELRNVIEQVVLMSDGDVVFTEDLPFERLDDSGAEHAGLDLPDAICKEGRGSLSFAERHLIRLALVDEHGNVSRAAQRLGVSRDTLRYRMVKHGLVRRA